MAISKLRCLVAAIFALLLTASALPTAAWAAEGLHPEGRDVRRRLEDDARGSERRNDEALARSREPWRGQDLTDRPKIEFNDAAGLEAGINARKLQRLSTELYLRRNEEGLYGLGEGSRAQAESLGQDWVGPNSRLSSDKKALVSADGSRVYRSPEFKPRQGREQANFERRVPDGSGWKIVSNGHLDIKD